MTFKRVITLLLALALAFSMAAMAGCDKKPAANAGTDRTSDTLGGAADDEFFDAVPDELKGSTVDFATWIDHYSNYSAAVFADFTALTGINVNLVKVAQGDYPVKMAALIASGQSPDVVVDIQFPSTAKLLMPLEDAGVDATDPFWDQEISKIGKLGKYHYLCNGENSLWRMGTPYVIFNRANMEDYGITTPTDYVENQNWTLETFKKCMDQCKKSIPNSTYGAAIAGRWFISVYGDPVFHFDSETSTFSNNSSTTASVNAWKWLLDNKAAGLCAIDDNQTAFAQSKAAMYLGGGYSMRQDGWFTDSLDSEDLGFCCLPKKNADDEKYPTAAQWRAYGVCKGAKDAQAAGFFLRYYLNGDHYDWDTVFKTSEAKELYKGSLGTWDYNRIDWCDPIILVDDISVTDILKAALGSTAAQINVNLQSMSTTVDGICTRGNAIIQEVIANQ